MSSVLDIIKQIKKKNGDDSIKIGVDNLEAAGTVSLGTPGLDFCVYNSIPRNRIIEFTGQEASGKTTGAFLLAASFQRAEMKTNPDSPRKILFIDLEHSLDPIWARKSGGYETQNHPVETIYYSPMDETAENILDNVLDFIKTGEVGLVILDSINMLVPQQVKDESLTKKEMGTLAKVLGDFVRRVKGLLVRYKCLIVGINQMRENIGGYGNPLTTSGGRGWKHACDVRLMFKKGKFYNENGDELSGSAESPAAYEMQVAVLKTKVCKWDRKLGRTIVNYDKGVDLLQDTIDMAIYFGLIDKLTQTTYAIIDPDTGEVMLNSEGKELKIVGRKNLKPYFENNLPLYRKIYDKVYEYIGRKEDPNIVSFEKMLNINIQEEFQVDFTKEDL